MIKKFQFWISKILLHSNSFVNFNESDVQWAETHLEQATKIWLQLNYQKLWKSHDKKFLCRILKILQHFNPFVNYVEIDEQYAKTNIEQALIIPSRLNNQKLWKSHDKKILVYNFKNPPTFQSVCELHWNWCTIFKN